MNMKTDQNTLAKELFKRLTRLPCLRGKGSQITTFVDIQGKYSLSEVTYGNWWYQYFAYKLYDKLTGKEILHLILHLEDTIPDGTKESFVRLLHYNGDGSLLQDRRAKSYSYPTVSESVIQDKVVDYIPAHLVSALLDGFEELEKDY